MGMRLQALIDATQKLPPRGRAALIRAVSRSSQHVYAEEAHTDFWEPKSLTYHIQLQGTAVVADIADLRADFWPEEDTPDDLSAYIYAQRAACRAKDHPISPQDAWVAATALR
jgi:hypothetical protein